MSVARSSEPRQTTIMDTATTSGGSEEQIEVDANEDRKIVGLTLIAKNVGSDEEHNAETEVWIGADPRTGVDTVRDSEQFYMRSDFTADSAAGQGAGYQNQGHIEFEEPFDWEKHRTLTLAHTEHAADGSRAHAVVHWVEA